MLLQMNEPAQALKEFEASFKAAPNRLPRILRRGESRRTPRRSEKSENLLREARGAVQAGRWARDRSWRKRKAFLAKKQSACNDRIGFDVTIKIAARPSP